MTGPRGGDRSPAVLAPADPVITHLRWLLAEGASLGGIGRQTGVTPQALGELLRGRHRQPTRATADAVLAITDPATCAPPPNRGCPGGRRGRRQSIWLEDVEMLADTGHTPDSAAHRLNVQRDSLYRHLHRRDRRDLWARLRANNGGARP